MDGRKQQLLKRHRRHERLPLALRVTARLGGRDYPLTTRDISVGGAALVGALPTAAHELPLRLEVPGRRTQVRLKARIVYRAAALPGDKAPPPTMAETGAAWRREIAPDPVLLEDWLRQRMVDPTFAMGRLR